MESQFMFVVAVAGGSALLSYSVGSLNYKCNFAFHPYSLACYEIEPNFPCTCLSAFQYITAESLQARFVNTLLANSSTNARFGQEKLSMFHVMRKHQLLF